MKPDKHRKHAGIHKGIEEKLNLFRRTTFDKEHIINALKNCRDNTVTRFASYTDPKIYSGARNGKSLDRDWFVYFQKRNAEGKMIRHRIKGGINEFKSIAERNKVAKALQQAYKRLLDNDYDPDGNIEDFFKQPTGIEILNLMPVNNALAWALDKRRTNILLKSYNDRINTLKYITSAIASCNFAHIAIKDFKKYHLKEALDYLRKTRPMSATRFNAYIECTKTLFNTLVDWDVIEFSIAQSVKYLKEEEPTTHIALTPEEIKQVADHLRPRYFEFYVYCKIIFRTGIRPLEIMHLKPGSFDFGRGEISLAPINTKTRKSRLVPMDDDLAQDILSLISSCSPDMYVFGMDLKPSLKMWHRNRVSELWNVLIRKGLKINKTMYALKHSGADARLRAGNTLEDVQHSFGHGSKSMTQIYARAEKGLSIQRLKQIIPEF